MVDSTQKEIEDELIDYGIRLIHRPHSTHEFLKLLDKVESLLLKVAQVPTDLTKNALRPVMKAMIGDELLRNDNVDVKVSVAACMSELSRITAPQQPYEDELMKEIFQLMVRVFEELSPSSCHYYKAVRILETMADIKAFVMLLDLESDTLIKEIFLLFLRIIRPEHPNVVFTKMENIMTLLIEESDFITMGLLQPLLDSVRKENQTGSPVSSKLGEKVLKECASTIKPRLLEALKSTNLNLDDYGEIVASICNEMPEGEQRNHSQTEQVKNTGISNGSHDCGSRAKKKERMAKNGTACSKRKPRQNSRKNEFVSKGDVDATSGLNIVEEEGNLSVAWGPSVDKKKQKNDRATIEIQDIDNSGEEAIKPSFEDEKSPSKGAKAKRPRELAMGKNEDSKRRHITKHFGEELVGARIKVWWPMDKVFYVGTVTFFDAVKKKHKVLYDDNYVENLNMSKQRWEMLEENPSDKVLSPSNTEVQEHGTNIQSNAISSVPLTKKITKGTSSKEKKPRVSSSKRSKGNGQKSDTESPDIPIMEKINDATDVGCETRRDLVDKEDVMIAGKVKWGMLEDGPSDQKNEGDIPSHAVSSIPSRKKIARKTSAKKEPGVSSSKRSKTNAQRTGIESVDIPIPAEVNGVADGCCETGSGKRYLVDKKDVTVVPKERWELLDDDPSYKEQETDVQRIGVSSVPSTKKETKRTSTKREPGVSSSKRSKKNAQKSDFESIDIPVMHKMNDATDVGCEMRRDPVDKEDFMIAPKERWEPREDNPFDKEHGIDFQRNAVSSVLSTKKKTKRISTKKEPGASSTRRLSIVRSKRNAQNDETESVDILVPAKVNDASDVGWERSSGKRYVADKDADMIEEAGIREYIYSGVQR